MHKKVRFLVVALLVVLLSGLIFAGADAQGAPADTTEYEEIQGILQPNSTYKFVFGSGTLASPCYKKLTWYATWIEAQNLVKISDTPAPVLYKHCYPYPEWQWRGANFNYTHGWADYQFIGSYGVVYHSGIPVFDIHLDCDLYGNIPGKAFCSRTKHLIP